MLLEDASWSASEAFDASKQRLSTSKCKSTARALYASSDMFALPTTKQRRDIEAMKSRTISRFCVVTQDLDGDRHQR